MLTSTFLRSTAVGAYVLAPVTDVPTEESESRPPITVKFEIPYFTTSGIQVRAHRNSMALIWRVDTVLQVRYLKIIEKSGYQALPWVRYITQNGGELTNQFSRPHTGIDYQIRTT